MQNHINYVEFAAHDLAATEQFFSRTFGWQFQHYGPDYIAFSNSGLEGGFYRGELSASTISGSALVVIYSSQLELTLERVQQEGGSINKDIFSFPGGRRFHFIEPSGNELAVWSDS
ncbi:VOC family protein [Pseudoalteromonas byunsanensis]|uniref:Glyoxalase n=1 Tax=Pseudoalteromonas byunsanensis TaxID=327939 RepID=A0A1S1N5Q1_9GAMM|nr:VOC family protein [Pseudoalteromonas byunsanensis]OHU93583.1 glyoxalase [Pseudoalteromonas byunsanensis]